MYKNSDCCTSLISLKIEPSDGYILIFFLDHGNQKITTCKSDAANTQCASPKSIAKGHGP